MTSRRGQEHVILAGYRGRRKEAGDLSVRSKRESIAMSATSYILVSLPNEQQPTDQVNYHVPAFAN